MTAMMELARQVSIKLFVELITKYPMIIPFLMALFVILAIVLGYIEARR